MRRILVLSGVLVVLALLLIPVTAMVSAAPAQQTTVTYVVQPGDNLFRIALRFNTTVQAIATANNIANPNLIFAGQTLIIPTGTTPPPTPPATPGQPVIYVVQPGDFLARIARQFNTTVSAIVAANNIANPNLIFPGQQLIIPVGGTVPPPVATSQPATSVPATSVPPTQSPGGTTTYVVQPGDTLGSIARRFGTTVTAIAQANNIVNPNLIFTGQVLIIPTGGAVVPTAPPPGPGPTAVPPPPGSTGFELGGQTLTFGFPTQMQQSGMRWAKAQIRYNLGDPASVALGAINTARSQGFKVLLSVLGNPAQLASNPSAYYSQFASFLGGVAALGPDAIEVWNEQNIDREWPAGQISGAAYTQMLSQAFQAIKTANASTLVISGAPAPTGFFGGCSTNGCDDDAFIRQMAAAGAANYADCIGVHYNEGVVPPNQTSGDPRGNPNHYTRYFPTMVNTYASVFPNKLLCFTELGYLSPEGLGPLPPGFEWAVNTTVQEQAEWLAQAAVLSRQSGRIRMMIVWNVDATTWGADPQAGFAIIRNGSCLACQTLGSVMGTS
ncbi:MAG TPA: LysM peptidoglycan-binding domain-containing protein [Candidatus Limnocylindrales bacterium]|nr:LysM peptidoglycan-binding domain-containing protein [Candidatus Limnocylindrales bacterium]